MSGERLLKTVLFVIIISPIFYEYGEGILTKNNACREINLQVTCDCGYGYPDLIINNATLSFAHNNVYSIIIKNCVKAILEKDSIRSLRSLRHLQISNITNLRLQESSLGWQGYNGNYLEPLPSITVTISDSRIQQIAKYTIKGTIAEFKLINVIIDKIEPFAFSSISKMILVEMKNSTINGAEAQAFKKFETEKLIITDSKIGVLPSRAFFDVEVRELFKIKNSEFDVIKPSAFIIKYPRKIEVMDSKFNVLEGDSFVIQSRGTVVIKNNQIKNLQSGAFSGIRLIQETRTTMEDLIFENNTINQLKKDSLLFNRTSFNVKLNTIILNQSCNCADIDIWITNNKWEQHIHCISNRKQKLTSKIVAYKNDYCSANTKTWVIVVSVVGALLVILIVVLVVIVIVYKKHKKQKEKEYVNRGRAKQGQLGLIVPDGRTYKETEVHVIVEKAELLTTEL